MRKIDLKRSDKKKLPIFCNYIYYNEMISKNIEDKLFGYSETNENIYGRQSSTKPISKIIKI